eukprot:CAMPEP_0198204502 /NCGR_PEP_ID=MMETSP1445-20131203/7910_1 /TAXON_ID=36898 /ORGANISM="Pyramimonas sp., Strain CCMP2087" /LENGTH=614 /DNA_ID=CAMNT_0043876401 /DNA_START=312 /DNA_END=2157 /DNA_ORIENTATION=-
MSSRVNSSQLLLDEVDEEWCGVDAEFELPKIEGWAELVSFSWWKRSQRFYFVLDGSDYVLKYYTDEKRTTLVGTLTLHPLHCDLHADIYHQLDLKTKINVLRLRFNTTDERQEWWGAMLHTQVMSRKYKCKVDENEEQPWGWGFCACGERKPPFNTQPAYKEEVKFEVKKVVGRTPNGRPIVTDNKGNTWTESKHLHSARFAYQEVLKALIRPKRAKYTMKDLGPEQFDFLGKKYVRKDFTVRNPRRMTLQCSRWVLKATSEEEEDISINDIFVAFHIAEPKPVKQAPCVVYLHGNASCRVEALQVLSFCLHLGLDLVTLDLSGSGLSEGEFVSLGYYEEDDVRVLCDYLRVKLGISQIALWGRSMGAVTAALYVTTRDPTIQCVVLDSPFTSLTELCVELVKRQSSTLPSWVVRVALQMVKRSVKYRAHFSLSAINPLANMANCFTPILFVHGESDIFIAPRHSEQLYKAAQGPKELLLDKGTHSDIRTILVFHAAQELLTKYMSLEPKEALFPVGATSSIKRNPYVTLPWKMGPLSPSDSQLSMPKKCEAADGDRWSWANGDHGELANGHQAEVTGSGEFVAGMSEARQAEVAAAVGKLFGQTSENNEKAKT